MLDHAIGPDAIGARTRDVMAFMGKRGQATLEDCRGLGRDGGVTHSHIRRPDDKA